MSARKAVKSLKDLYWKGTHKKKTKNKKPVEKDLGDRPTSPEQPQKKTPSQAPWRTQSAGMQANSQISEKRISDQTRPDLKKVSIEYPLTPRMPKDKDRVYAWTSIRWDASTNSLIYYVNEPELTDTDKVQIRRIKDIIEEKLDIKFDALQKEAAIRYLKEAIDDIILQFGVSLVPAQREAYEYYILRDFVGFGKIQPILNDSNIEDISCDGVNVPLFVYHRDPKFGSLKTNIVFTSQEELDSFVMKVAQRCNKSISVAEPLLDGALPDGSRVQATLATDIAKRGSNFTIRKFAEEPLTPVHLMEGNTADPAMMAYIWYMIEHNKSVLISGATASGKTSLLNAISLFIRPSMKIISIEDTPELRLPHTHWIPEVAREGFDSGANTHEKGQVTMFHLLKGALRQRPDYIIVGEVRGQEAYVLFQAMATGHAGIATIHADSVEKVIDRLTTKPIDLPASLLETLDVIVFAKRLKYRDRYVRRITNIAEINGYDAENGKVNKVASFEWNPSKDKFETPEQSKLLEKIAYSEGISMQALYEELERRTQVLEWIKNSGFKNYKQFSKIITQYYNDPNVVMGWAQQEK